MTNKSSLSDDIRQQLDKMHAAEDMAEQIVKQSEGIDLWPSDEQIKQVRGYVGKWDWDLKISHKVLKAASQPQEWLVMMEFEVDIHRLKKGHKKSAGYDLEAMTASLEGDEEGKEELDEIVMDAMKARTYGLSSKITLQEVSAPDGKEEMFEDKVGIVEVFLQDALVHVNYAQVVNALMDGKLVVDGDELGKKLWVPVDSFKFDKPIVQDVAWEENGVEHEVGLEFVKK